MKFDQCAVNGRRHLIRAFCLIGFDGYINDNTAHSTVTSRSNFREEKMAQ